MNAESSTTTLSQPDSKPAGRIERILTTIALFFSTGALLTMRVSASEDFKLSSGTDATQQAVWAVIYGLVVFAIAKNTFPYLVAARRNLIFIALTVWCLMSPLWAVEPSYTLARAIALFGTMLFGLYLGTRYTRLELLHMMAVALFWFGALSIFVSLFLPQYSIDDTLHVGAWRGIMNHKNNFGRICALGVLIFFICVRDANLMPYRKLFYRAGLVIMIICSIMSASKTSLLLALMGVSMYFPLRMMGGKNPLIHVLLATGVAILAVLATSGFITYLVESSLAAMDRDTTMTGRTDIWYALFIALRDHWWAGYGPGGFWISGKGALGMIWPNGGWLPPHAHNGIMELWVGLGFIGVMMFAVAYLGALRAGFKALKPNPAVDIFPIAYFVLMLTADMTEISIMRHNNTYWVLFVALVVRLNIESGLNVPRSKAQELALAIRANVARLKS